MKTKEVVALMNISQDTLRYYEKGWCDSTR